MKAPKKPFPDYKWRWATLTPTEGLNEPPVFLGVLRVLEENQGGRTNSYAVTEGLQRVQADLMGRVKTSLNLVREGQDRNLLRNSQQYWKALGVLESGPAITVSPFGIEVAQGRITKDEFAATVVKTLELPNRKIQQPEDIQQWVRHRLRIKPLELLLRIMEELGKSQGDAQASLTPDELTKVVIPLAGDPSTETETYVEALALHRAGRLDLSQWPNCAPEDNDPRMAREFLLFLEHYGFCTAIRGETNSSTRFVLQRAEMGSISTLVAFEIPAASDATTAAASIRNSGAASFVERQRAMREMILRPKQGAFRKSILGAYAGTCLLTGERIPETLEAAHIIPVGYDGNDVEGNGICLRSDVHSLFDSGHIRIQPDGVLRNSGAVTSSRNYLLLPKRVRIPAFVSPECITWRWNYQ